MSSTTPTISIKEHDKQILALAVFMYERFMGNGEDWTEEAKEKLKEFGREYNNIPNPIFDSDSDTD